MERGQRVGLIKFGSRVDVVIPAEAALRVKVGERVKGGASVLAAMPQGEPGLNVHDSLRDPAKARARQARLRRGMYLLPSLFTSVQHRGRVTSRSLQTIEAISRQRADAPGLGGDRDSVCDSVRRAGRAHCAHDEHVQRVWQGAGFAGRRDYVWRGAEPAGVCVGIPFSARLHAIRSCTSTCCRRARSSVFCFC